MKVTVRKNNTLLLLSYLLVMITAVCSCDDNDSFTTSYTNQLTISRSTLSFDTVFSKVPSASKKLMMYNHSGDGVRITSVEQSRGAEKSGFRVNVNGMYISPDADNRLTTPIELRSGDSLRVWVEITSQKENNTVKPQKVEDNILFNLESGRQQAVNLYAWTWDADTLQDHTIATDSLIDNKGERPLVVHGKLTVAPEATLTIAAGSIVYFHQDGELNVDGRLVISGEKDKLVTLRCDRLDSLLQLSYDEIPGKWQGITLSNTSHDNTITYLDLHGSEYGIKAEGDGGDKGGLSIDHSIIMNTLGDGIACSKANVSISNCLIANTSGYLLNVTGGNVSVNSSTLASFYGYTSSRKYALRMTDINNDNGTGNGNGDDDEKKLPLTFRMTNSIVTGYADDQVYWFPYDMSTDPDILIQHCYLRTPKPDDEYSAKMLQDNLYDSDTDEIMQGRALFNYVNDDGTSFKYDFTPKPGTPVIGAADPATSCTDDILGTTRKATPDMGCYETTVSEKESEEESKKEN